MYLRCSVQQAPAQWKNWLSLAEMWYNSSFHAAIGCTPFKALYGYDVNMGLHVPATHLAPDSLTDWIQHRELHVNMLKEQLAIAQNRMKTSADRKRTAREFQVGELVLLKLQPYA